MKTNLANHSQCMLMEIQESDVGCNKYHVLKMMLILVQFEVINARYIWHLLDLFPVEFIK